MTPTKVTRPAYARWAGFFLSGCFLAGVTAVGGEPGPAANPQAGARVSPLDAERVASLSVSSPAAIPANVSLPVEGNAVYLPLQIEFRDAAARKQFRAPEGVAVFHEFDRFGDAFLDVRLKQSIDDLQAMEGVTWVDIDMDVIQAPPLPKVTPSGERPREVHQVVRGGFGGLTGKGVLVAVIDDGVDFRHKDFVTLDDQGLPVSRLAYYWDTFAGPPGEGRPGTPAPFTYPNGAPIGMVYNKEELTAEIRNPTGLIAIDGQHGTCCAGVAAGNGQSRPDRKFAGVAPDAELIAVRIGRQGPWNQYLLGAVCDWLDAKAGDRPLVITCSFGDPQHGGRDGCRVLERQLDARFAAQRKGRAICIAAGNEGGNGGVHGETSFEGPEAKGVLAWTMGPSSYRRLSVYVQTDKPDDVEMTVKADPAPQVHRYVHPLSGALVIELGWEQSRAPAGLSAEAGQVELWSKSRTPLHADAYIDTEPWMSGSFRGYRPTPPAMLRTPGSMRNAITVGSYDFNDVDDRGAAPIVVDDYAGMPMKLGDLSTYSSPGYDRLGDVKPLLVSPGQWHITPMAGGGPLAPYKLFNGTSAATPYTAGVVALLLQKRPDITFGEIKTLLQTHVTSDDFTGRTPNPRWGYGRLDYQAVRAVLEDMK